MNLALPLVLAAITVGSLHSLAPDHWVPIAAVSRARGWGAAKTARVALLCGFGHVTVSVALGLVGLVTGRAAMETIGTHAGAVSGLLLIGFGVTYAAWSLHRHAHAHQHEAKTVGALFAIYAADPCVAVIPILFAAAPLATRATIGIVVCYEAATIATMVGLVALARAGASVLRGHWVEHYGDAAAGGLVAVTGVAVALLGW
jgi:hypothetical protein